MPTKVVSVVAGEDVRHEVGQKMSLMGVLNPSFQVSDFPVDLKMCFLVVVEVLGGQSTPIELRVLHDVLGVVNRVKFDLGVTEDVAGLPIFFAPMIIHAVSECTITMEECLDDAWRPVQAWTVARGVQTSLQDS